MTQEWDAFFSHSTRRSSDTRTDRIVDGVYLCLTARGRQVFWDLKCEVPKGDLVGGLREVIDHSRIAVFFMNAMFCKSSWAAEFEPDHVGRRYRSDRTSVLCLRLEPELPIPDWVSKKDVMDIPPTTQITEAVRLICDRLNQMLDPARRR